MKQKKAELEDALFSLIDALNDPDARERDFQEIFEAHPDILYSLGYSEFLEEPRMHDPLTSEDYYPDFIARRAHDQREEVVDLKLPDLAVKVIDKRGRRKRFSAEMQEYISQVSEYAEYFNDRTNQDWFRGEHGWDISLRPTSKIIGGGFDVNRDEVNRLLDGRGVTLSTYVDVLNVLMQEHSRRYSSQQDAFAWQVMTSLRLHEQEGSGDERGLFYIIDRGHKFTRNRCSLWLTQDGFLGFTAFDNERRKVELRSPNAVSTGEFMLVTVEFQASANGCVAALLVNGRTVDYHLSSAPFEIEQKLLARKKYVGGNLRAEHGAYFDMGEYAEFDRVLSVEERVQAYAHVWSALTGSDADAGARFFPDSVMSLVAGGMQIVPGKRKPLFLGQGKRKSLSGFFQN